MKKLITLLLTSISASAFADTTAAMPVAGATAQQPSSMPTIIMLIVFVAIFYFLIFRPQMKRSKEQRQLISSIQKGDEVLTSSGICGTITNIDNNFVELEVSKGVVVKFQKEAIVSLLPKTSTPTA